MPSLTRRVVVLAAPAFTLRRLRAATPPKIDFAAIERASGGRLGACVIDTGTGATRLWRGDQRFPFCSSYKALLAAFVLWKVDRGQMRLARLVSFRGSDLLPYAPLARAHL